jgi:hypothetical protein
MVRQKSAAPVQQIDGEEPASAKHHGTAIIRRGNDRLAWTQAAGRVAISNVVFPARGIWNGSLILLSWILCGMNSLRD